MENLVELYPQEDIIVRFYISGYYRKQFLMWYVFEDKELSFHRSHSGYFIEYDNFNLADLFECGKYIPNDVMIEVYSVLPYFEEMFNKFEGYIVSMEIKLNYIIQHIQIK